MSSEEDFLCEVVEQNLSVTEEKIVNGGLGREEQRSNLTANERQLLHASFKILLHYKLIDTAILQTNKL